MTVLQKKKTSPANDSEQLRLRDISLTDIGWFVIVNLLLFEPTLQSIYAPLSYLDELSTILVVLCGLSAAIRCRDHIWDSLQTATLILLFAITVIGLISNLAFSIQSSWMPILIDVFTCCKFVLTLLFGATFLGGRQRLLKLLILESKFLICVMLACALISQFYNLGMSGEIRYGIKSFMFIWVHPEFMNLALVSILIILLTERKQNTIWIVLSLLLMCLSLRGKAIGFAGLMLVILLTMGSNKKPSKFFIAIGVIAAIYLGYDQLFYYYTLEGSARLELTRVSVELANTYFPLGSGFGTFASYASGMSGYYSPIYYKYGLYAVYGLYPYNPTFLSDTFWPIPIGQFGWIGACLFVGMLIVVSIWALKRSSNNGYMTAIVLFAYLLISSTAQSSFFHPTSVCLAICFCLTLPSKNNTGDRLNSYSHNRKTSSSKGPTRT